MTLFIIRNIYYIMNHFTLKKHSERRFCHILPTCGGNFIPQEYLSKPTHPHTHTPIQSLSDFQITPLTHKCTSTLFVTWGMIPSPHGLFLNPVTESRHPQNTLLLACSRAVNISSLSAHCEVLLKSLFRGCGVRIKARGGAERSVRAFTCARLSILSL